MMRPSSDPCFKERTLGGESGQIVLEYILLLVVGVAIAALVTTTMVSRNPDSQGFLITKWIAIIQTISSDMADDVNNGT
jgi:uncharacterized protein (UPF0333 family)